MTDPQQVWPGPDRSPGDGSSSSRWPVPARSASSLSEGVTFAADGSGVRQLAPVLRRGRPAGDLPRLQPTRSSPSGRTGPAPSPSRSSCGSRPAAGRPAPSGSRPPAARRYQGPDAGAALGRPARRRRGRRRSRPGHRPPHLERDPLEAPAAGPRAGHPRGRQALPGAGRAGRRAPPSPSASGRCPRRRPPDAVAARGLLARRPDAAALPDRPGARWSTGGRDARTASCPSTPPASRHWSSPVRPRRPRRVPGSPCSTRQAARLLSTTLPETGFDDPLALD